MTTILEPPTQRWECPSCDHRHIDHQANPRSVMHDCAGLGGLSAPMSPVAEWGETAKWRHRVQIWGDDVGSYLTLTDPDGTPVSAVYTDRPDGSFDACAYPGSVNISNKAEETT